MLAEIGLFLDQAAKTYGFSTVKLGVMDVGGSRRVFTADVHWSGGASTDSNPCAGGLSDTSLEDAFDQAVANANEKRAPFYTAEGAFPTYSFGGIAA